MRALSSAGVVYHQVGAEAIVESGGIINTVGTYQMALVSKATNTPFYVVGESFKFVRLYPLNQSEIPVNQTLKLALDLPYAPTIDSISPMLDYTPLMRMIMMMTMTMMVRKKTFKRVLLVSIAYFSLLL